uniref:Uncharacterized protein n=1 Tax=Populus alba TaxID=43335 RepID=A0A4U5QP03_POPAL|nr:hypothetical protein D5086_0000066150 [Populus alba]
MTATVVEEKQLLFLTMAASQATEVRAVTTEKRKRGGKERRVPSVASGLNLLTVAGVLDDAAAMAGAYSRTQRRHSACIGPFRFWVNERKSNVYGLDDVGWLKDGIGYTIVPRGCWNLVEKMASLVLCGVKVWSGKEKMRVCLKRGRREAYGGESRSVTGSLILLWEQKK